MKKKNTNAVNKMLAVTIMAVAINLTSAFSQEPAIDNDLITYSMAVSPDQQVKFRFPLDMRSGDKITGTVVEKNKTNVGEVTKASSTLEGVVIEIDGKQTKLSNRLFSFIVPAGITSLPFLLKNSAGQVLEQGQIPINSYFDTKWQEPVGGLGDKFAPEAVGQPGKTLRVTGFFDGDAANTNVSLNGQTCEIIAESPRMSLVNVSNNSATGVSNLTVEEKGTKEEHKINIAKLNLSANKTTLRKGEKATITVTVSGLEGLKEGYDCKVNINNLSPANVRFKNNTGNSLSHPIPSGLKGDHKFVFNIVGVTQGNYTLQGVLFCAPVTLPPLKDVEKNK